MPTYGFVCPRCGAAFDLVRSMADADEPATCPQGHPARRTLSFGGALSGRGAATLPPGRISNRVLRGPAVATHDHVVSHRHDDTGHDHGDHDHPHDHSDHDRHDDPGHDHG